MMTLYVYPLILVEYVNEIKYVNDDIICVSFNFMPEIPFCGCYSPPSDSKYFDMNVFAEMNSIIPDSGNRFVIFGDFNAKVKDREGLLRESDNMNYYTHENNSNSNGEYLRSICVDSDLIVLNNLKYYENYFSDLSTFRRRNIWISQLDLCIISKSIINQVTSFDVNQDLLLPSDHAPIILGVDVNYIGSSYESLLKSSKSLIEPGTGKTNNAKRRKAIHIGNINIEELSKRACEHPPPTPPTSLVDFQDYCDRVYSDLYELSFASINKEEKLWDTDMSRWKRLLNSCDAKCIWKAINWKGCINDDSAKLEPAEQDFKKHFEELLNPQREPTADPKFENSPYIPILDDVISLQEVKAGIKDTNPNKAVGLNGISPGIFRHISIPWLVVFTFIMNVAFDLLILPTSWIYSKLIVIFKKGVRTICGNYRGNLYQ